MSRKGKRIVIIVLVVLVIVLLFPVRLQLKDGGTVKYEAILYEVSKVHRLTEADGVKPYEEGLVIEILGLKVFDNVK